MITTVVDSWVEVPAPGLVYGALDGSMDALRVSHRYDVEGLRQAAQDLLVLEDLLAIESIEREMLQLQRSMRVGGLSRRLEDSLRRWFVDPVAARPRLFAAAAVAAVAVGAWLWRSGVFGGDDDDEAGRCGGDGVDEEARCPICLEREVSAARGTSFGDFFFVELCCCCGATCCEPCARSVARHAKRGGGRPLCALCRGELAAPSAERYLRLKHLVVTWAAKGCENKPQLQRLISRSFSTRFG